MSRRVRTRRTGVDRPIPANRRLRLERLVYAVLLVLVALAFSTTLESQFTLPKLLALRALTPIVCALWTWRMARGEARPLPRAVLATGVAMNAWWIVTTLTAAHPHSALEGLHGRYNGLWQQEICFFLFVAVASAPFDLDAVVRLAKVFVAALVPVSLYAIAQFAGWDPIPWPAGRSASTIGNPVILAAVLALGMPFALVFALARRRAATALWGAALCLLGAAAATTLSRGPLVAAVVAVAIVLAGVARDLRPDLGKRALAAGGVVLAALLAAGYFTVSGIRDRTSPVALESEGTIRGRFYTVTAALGMIRDHPVVGVGVENFGLLYPRYRNAASERLTPDVLPTMVHNGYVQTAATTGVPGLVLYLAFAGSILATLWNAWRRNVDRRARWLAVACIASACAYLVQDLSGWLEISLSVFVWFVLGLGTALAAQTARPVTASPPRTWMRRAAVASGAALTIAAIALAVRAVDMVRADQSIRDAQRRSVKDDWPSMEADLAAALARAGDDAAYRDKAGVRYAQRYAATGDRAVYERSAALFDEAHRLDPFNPYFLLHRVDLETAELQKKATTRASAAADAAIAAALAMDVNNAAAHESAARLELAEGKAAAASAHIQTARTLRPAQPRYAVLDGDIRRAMNDRRLAIAAYRSGLAQIDPGDAAWAAASHKLILVLVEDEQLEAAAAEARRVIVRVPSDTLAHTLLGIAITRIEERREQQSIGVPK